MFQSDTIKLRKVEPTDLPLLYAWENDDSAWLDGSTHNPLSQKDLRDYIANSTGDIYKDGQLRLIAETLAGQTIGCIDLYDFDPHQRRAGVGIYIDSASRRHGYALRSLKILQQYAFGFLNLRLLYAFVSSSNQASINLFTKAGFVNVANLPNWLLSGSVEVFCAQS